MQRYCIIRACLKDKRVVGQLNKEVISLKFDIAIVDCELFASFDNEYDIMETRFPPPEASLTAVSRLWP